MSTISTIASGIYFCQNGHAGRLTGACQVGVLSSGKKSLFVKAIGGSSNASVEKVNGRKVNGLVIVNEKLSKVVEDRNASMQAFKLGIFVEGRFVYRQTFVIRSYEIGPDKTATMETWMNLLQETALNHVMSSGLASDGFGATHEMSLRKLIWGDIVEIDTWVAASGKNGMRRDWIIRDYSSQEIITRATSTWVIMHRETRRLSKMPEPVREEIGPYLCVRKVIPHIDNDFGNIDKLDNNSAQHIRSGLAPRWSDMDVNQHVNNVKYIGWILESVPVKVLEDYKLTSLTLEYRRECRQSHLLESLTSMKAKDVGEKKETFEGLGSTHLLRLQSDRAEVVRARADWQHKEHA